MTVWPCTIIQVRPKDATIKCYKLNGKGGFLKVRSRPCVLNHFKYKLDINPEKYFHTLLLLFKPGRKFEDLKDGYATYAKSFQSFKNTLPEALKYYEKLTEIEKAFKQAKELVQKKLNEYEKEDQEKEDNEVSLECHSMEVDLAIKDLADINDNIQDVILKQLQVN